MGEKQTTAVSIGWGANVRLAEGVSSLLCQISCCLTLLSFIFNNLSGKIPFYSLVAFVFAPPSVLYSVRCVLILNPVLNTVADCKAQGGRKP